MNPQSLPLRDIHLPPEPGFWPLAPGWWVLLGLVLLLALLGLWRWRVTRLRRARLKSVKQLLRRIATDYAAHQNTHRLAQDLSNLLRRHVRYVLGDAQATRLSGRDWADYLSHLLPADRRSLQQVRRWRQLEQAAFNPHVPDDQVQQWLEDVEQVIDLSMRRLNSRGKKVEASLV